MKTYAIVGNQYEGVYTKPWSEVQKYTHTKPAPKYKGFATNAEAQAWFADMTGANGNTARTYEVAYDGTFEWQADRYYIFTDGGTRNTGNVAGGHVQATDKSAWAIAIYRGDQPTQASFADSGAFLGKTNNEMEIYALINALQQAKKVSEPVTIVSDSKYVLDTVTDWMYNWQAAGWTKKTGAIANLAAWQLVYSLVLELSERLAFIWVKGHATSAGNVLVDELLNQEMDRIS
ncbi:MAG: ribonuclease H family protein [Lactobacillaceae bacterium]|jgi:ribonuclease HI|nr:ribonuclease H family protein [Lactobacillaceae bacterium]